MTAIVKITDNRARYDKLIKTVVGLDREILLEFGIFGAKGGNVKKGMLSIVEIAAVHEFGAPSMGIPKRSFLAAYIDENEAKLREALARLLEAVIAGKYTREQAFELFAMRVVAEMKKRISAGISPQVTKETQRRKGPTKTIPLVNTGQLRNSLTYRVREGANVMAFPDTEDAGLDFEQRKDRKRAAAKEERSKVTAAKKTARADSRAKARAQKKASKAATKARSKKIKTAKKAVVRAVKDRVKAVKTVLRAARTVKKSQRTIARNRKKGGS